MMECVFATIKGETYQLYISSSLGKIFFPLSFSFAKNRFSSKKLGVVTSSLSTANQLSCIVSISSFSKSRVAAGRLEAHFSLSNLGRGGAGGAAGAVVVAVGSSVGEVVAVVAEGAVAVGEEEGAAAGAEKNEVILFCFCFLPVEAGMEPGSLRLRGVDILHALNLDLSFASSLYNFFFFLRFNWF